MIGELLHFPSQEASPQAAVGARLARIVSIFRAIEAGQLLAALPDCPMAQADHRAALTLLATIEVEVVALCNEMGCGLGVLLGAN